MEQDRPQGEMWLFRHGQEPGVLLVSNITIEE